MEIFDTYVMTCIEIKQYITFQIIINLYIFLRYMFLLTLIKIKHS